MRGPAGSELRRDHSRTDRWSLPHDSETRRFEFRWLENRTEYVALNTLMTDSTAPDFEGDLPQLHITTVGRPSNGSTGQPLFFELPGDGGAIVVTKRHNYPEGRDFVGVGVQPDIGVEPTVADVRAGRDATLQRAVAVIRQQLRG